LRILRMMLGKKKSKAGLETHFDIMKISEAYLGAPERSVPFIVQARTFAEFMSMLGSEVHKDEADISYLMKYLQAGTDADGAPLERAIFSMSVHTGAYAVVNARTYFTPDSF